MSGSDKKSSDSALSNYTSCPVQIEESLFDDMAHHVQLVKVMDYKVNNTNWVLSAIREKLSRGEFDPYPEKPKTKLINVPIDRKTDQQLTEKVKELKEKHGNYSKRKIILDAISEKLDRDHEEMKKKVSHLLLNT